MAGKSVREKISLVSTGLNAKGKPTGTYYTTTTNKRNRLTKSGGASTKLEFRKYDPLAIDPKTGKRGVHVLFKEKKIAK